MKKQLLLFLMMFLPMMAWAVEVEINGFYFDLNTKAKTAEVTYPANYNPYYYSGSVVIPEKVKHEGTEYSVTSIGSNAFRDCPGLSSVTIPGSVTSIGDHAFRDCPGLSSVTIPGSVTRIGNNAFYNCSGLTSITIPASVTSIGEFVLLGCTSLASISIPSSVSSIGRYAFYNCRGLTSIAIPNSVTRIGNSAFYGCIGLTSITIPNNVTSIGEHVFAGCTGLTSITIPNGVTSIGKHAFRECTGLTSITIPNSVTSIGDYAFASCTGLLDMFCYAENVPQTGDYVFNWSNIAIAKLHVLAESVDAYLAAEPWNQFKAIVPLSNQEVNIDGINSEYKKETVRYTIGGIRTWSSQKGLNIVRMIDGTTKKLLK